MPINSLMPHIQRIVEQTARKAEELREGLKEQPWAELDSDTASRKIEEAVERVRKIRDAVTEIGTSREMQEIAIDTKTHSENLRDLNVLLKRNMEFEKQKSKKPSIEFMAQKKEYNELYSSLEEKIESNALNIQHLMNRITIQLKARGMQEKEAKTIAEKLEQKENELKKHRERIGLLERTGLYEKILQQRIPEIEQELQETISKYEIQSHTLKEALEKQQNALDQIIESHHFLAQKTREMEEHKDSLMKKSNELIVELKKERDSAKKAVMEIEHSTTSIRNSYAKELASLREEKEGHRKELGKKYFGKIHRLETEVEEKSNLLKHFREQLEEKTKKEKQLFEQLEETEAKLEQYAKNEKIKQRLKKTKK